MTKGLFEQSWQGSCGCVLGFMMIAAILGGIALYSAKSNRERIENAGHTQAEIFRVTQSGGYEYKFTAEKKVYTGTWDQDAEPGHQKGDVIPVSYSRFDPWVNNYGTTFRIRGLDQPAVWWLLAALAFFMALGSLRRNPYA